MEEDVYVGIDLSKTDLVAAVRPGGESFRLAYDRAGFKQLVGRRLPNLYGYSYLDPGCSRG